MRIVNWKAELSRQRLSSYSNEWFDRGRPAWVEVLWIIASALVSSPFPGSRLRVLLLKLFGAEIAEGVVIKQRVMVKFPWKLAVGAHTWIGEGVWIDNLEKVVIGRDCCLSQGVYLCTGNHDWSAETFDLVAKPVVTGDGCWVGAFARISPGVSIGDDAVVAMGSVVTDNVVSGMVVQGNPASYLKKRD